MLIFLEVNLKSLFKYFSLTEKIIWISSVLSIVISFLIFDRESYLVLIASLIGVTALIFSAKGNPIGQALMVAFSIMYGIISFSFSYYGEMLTYLGMTMPMAILALISWVRNPYRGNKSEVKVGGIGRLECLLMLLGTVAVTVAFYFILKAFGTSNIIPSTFSVATSFLAVYLTFRRSPYFALAYAANDVVLIVMWIMAATVNINYLSVVICFGAFLVGDVYGFISWCKMKRRQAS